MSSTAVGRVTRYTAAAAVMLGSSAISAHATDFTAGAVMQKMSNEERFSYLAGVVEGLAYARYIKDGKQTVGMKCIYSWFYDDKNTIDMI